jgi:hypothetical protein
MSNAASPHDPAESPAVMVIAHPPERRQGRSSVPAQAGPGCCCCCCCCLHTLGAIIGAAVAPNLGGGPKPRSYVPLTHYWDEEADEPGAWPTSAREREAVTAEPPASPTTPVDPVRLDKDERGIALPAPGPSAVSLFWWTVVVLVFLATVGIYFWNRRDFGRNGEAVVIIGIILLLGFPGLQLGAAVVTAFILAVSDRPDKIYQLRQLGKIVGGLVAGTAIGLLAMALLCGVFSLR